MRPPLVLYHDNCPDGFTAAWAAWCYFGDSAEYRGVVYGQAPPEDVDGREIVLVDFTFPRHVLNAISQRATYVTVYDHHKTAEADLKGWAEEDKVKRFCLFDMERSGAGIAWDEFSFAPAIPHPRGPRPALVQYVEDRDLWRWALPDSREISEWVFSIPRTFVDWSKAAHDLEHNPAACIQAGQALLRAKRGRVAQMCKHVRWGMLHGYPVPYVNASWDFSEVGEYLIEQYPATAFGAYYFDRADARQWGMRGHQYGVDVSTVAKVYGGGGHAAAAGFQTEIGWLPDPITVVVSS